MNLLGLLSLPIIFLALLTTLCGMETVQELKWLGRKVIFYTLSTTFVAASVALGLFLWIRPAAQVAALGPAPNSSPPSSYLHYVVEIVPRNLFAPFMEGKVVSVLLMALAFGLALLQVPERQLVHRFCSACLAALLKLMRGVCCGIPLIVWAGVSLSFNDLRHGPSLQELMRYLAVVLGANLIQGFGILPIFLKLHGIAPYAAMRQFAPALSLAFFSKSSVATVPLAIETAEARLGVHSKVARFVFPVCTSINMNGCAAFILTTTLYVSMANGRSFTPYALILWVGIATLAAVGNAGVPMGCYFLASAMLAANGVPLAKMSLILPFYSVLDMVETSLNVWSDGCVALMVDQQYRARPPEPPA
jgi:Na+/H+-dicarboxylate symporter